MIALGHCEVKSGALYAGELLQAAMIDLYQDLIAQGIVDGILCFLRGEMP
ncbi:MAG: hypothetical protein H5T61_03790 [Thermoflexales bacterium]|nr:hypothetical protein [Thermoflexales bacterium]